MFLYRPSLFLSKPALNMFWINGGQILDYDAKKLPAVSAVQSYEELRRGRFLSLGLLKYKDDQNHTRPYETTNRVTRAKDVIADAVDVFATTRGGGRPPCLVLVRQFRPPHNAYVIEPPAGLMDGEGEAPITTALRELSEETGLFGVADGGDSPPLCLEGGMSSCTTVVVRVTVDLDDERNRAPRMHGEEGEYVETILAPMDSLVQCLRRLSDDGNVIDAKVWGLAVGLQQARALMGTG